MNLQEKLTPKPRNTAPHIIVEALAGTGKTTTLIEGLKVIQGITVSINPSPQQRDVWNAMALSKEAKTICFVAFNKAIATELQERVPAGCDAMTMHSMGLKAVTKMFGRVKVSSWRVQDIISELLEKDIREIRKKDFELLQATEKLVNLCKMNLTGPGVDAQAGLVPITEDGAYSWEDILDDLAGHYDVDLNGNRSRVYDLVPQVLERCKDVARDGRIDFADMIWLPVALDLSVFRYDLLLVDECQDLNRCQQALARKAGDRLVLCGDTHQAIYGFAGADAESMNRLQEELAATEVGVVTLPLTVTRRCSKVVVEEAKQIVPAFEAHESNSEGTIGRASYKGETPQLPQSFLTDEGEIATDGSGPVPGSYHPLVKDGDMCLCRVNAPLVSQCFRFLKAGRKANIQGRDVGAGLISTVKKMKADNVADLVGKLDDWLHAETEKENRKRMPQEGRLIGLQDRYDCLVCFTESMATVEAVIERIGNVFTDDKHSAGIKLSSIHKAKGLEAQQVFLLEPKGATVPHPMAKSNWQRAQEMNLRYVAITRAIESLVYVTE